MNRIILIILGLALLFTGCSNKEADMVNFSNVYGNFIISAPSDFDYYDDGTYSNGIFLIGTEDGSESVMVLAMGKTADEFYTVEGLAANYEDGLFYGETGFSDKTNEIFYEDFKVEGAVEALAKSFSAKINNTKFLVYTSYIEFEEEYYIIQITSAVNGRKDNYYMETLNSFERKVPFDNTDIYSENDVFNFDFEFSENWTYIEGEEHDYLMSIDGKATFLPFSMEEELDMEDIHEYMEIAKEIVMQIHENPEIIYEEFKVINGLEAGVIVYEYSQEDEIVLVRQTCMIKGKEVYILTYSSDRETYNLLLDEVIYMEESFQIFD